MIMFTYKVELSQPLNPQIILKYASTENVNAKKLVTKL